MNISTRRWRFPGGRNRRRGTDPRRTDLKRILCLVLCLGLLSLPLHAQQSPARTEQVGLRASTTAGPLNFTLEEAVRFAVENNANLKIEKIRVEQARWRVEEHQGEFYPLINSSTHLNRRDKFVAIPLDP